MKMTSARRAILQEALDRGHVQGYAQRRWPCSLLAREGLLVKINFTNDYAITDAGRVALQDRVSK